MLRKMKVFFCCISLALVLANCQTANAAMVTYELGPFQVESSGTTPELAKANTYGEMYDQLVEIENNLPEGHVMLEFVIEAEGWTSTTGYYIEFHVLVWIPTPPGPPGGV